MLQKQIQLEIFDLGRRLKRENTADKIPTRNNLGPKFPIQLCVKIASVMLITIVSFTIGVEHGKSLYRNNTFKPVIAEKKDTLQPKEIKPLFSKDNTDKQVVKEKAVSFDEYTIQVVTYKKDSSYVEKEISRLKQKGYAPFIIPRNDYIQLCA
jgi:hypothetical protein